MAKKVIETWSGRREVLELFDVTDAANEVRHRPSGWRVKMTRQVWERYVGRSEDNGEGDSVGHRLADICSNLWNTMMSTERPADWVLGGFEFGIAAQSRWIMTPEGKRAEWMKPLPVRLTAVAFIDTDGSPAIVVLVPHDHDNYASARRGV